LEQGEFFHGQSTHLVLVKWTSKSFKSRDHAFPRIGGHVVRSRVVRSNDKLHQDIPFVAKSQIAQGCFSITSSSSLGDVKRATDLDELRGGSFRNAELNLDVLV
jgi:hypothetical protein